MERLTEGKEWNPYSWRLEEIALLGASRADQMRRDELVSELVVAEAREVADGVRHVSVVHGDPPTLPESIHLNDLFARVKRIASEAPWSRLRGTDTHLIVAMAGPDADDLAERVAEVASAMNPGHWLVVLGARPELT